MHSPRSYASSGAAVHSTCDFSQADATPGRVCRSQASMTQAIHSASWRLKRRGSPECPPPGAAPLLQRGAGRLDAHHPPPQPAVPQRCPGRARETAARGVTGCARLRATTPQGLRKRRAAAKRKWARGSRFLRAPGGAVIFRRGQAPASCCNAPTILYCTTLYYTAIQFNTTRTGIRFVLPCAPVRREERGDWAGTQNSWFV